MPPLVAELRKAVKQWRDTSYSSATDTSNRVVVVETKGQETCR
jgi:hypothetical protein